MTKTIRAVMWVVVIAVAVVVLFTWVFPWVEERTQDPVVGFAPPAVIAGVDQVARAPR